jgi:hypothetical protein
VLQTSPAQHVCPLPPHAAQRRSALHPNGSEQKSPPETPVQQRWPRPPHGWHVLLAATQSVNGAVQPTPPAQQAWPLLPQVPPPQPPPVHVPAVAPHEAAAATHVGLPAAFWLQQPPAPQPLPSQHS